MPIIDGDMQWFALTLDRILDHAAKWHPDTEVVTARRNGDNARTGYTALRERALRVSGVLAGLGVGVGQRVATLAWNTQAHFEAWFAIMSMGATCHTLNPRLTADQTASMLNQSGAEIAIVSADLLPLAITRVTPDQGGTGDDDHRWVTVDIRGARFAAGALVKLSRPGVFEVEPERWQVLDATHIRAVFDLRHVPHGLYDLTVMNPDGQRVTEPYRYLVESVDHSSDAGL